MKQAREVLSVKIVGGLQEAFTPWAGAGARWLCPRQAGGGRY